jgi:ABC-type lipoprotein export system ATPase subunit
VCCEKKGFAALDGVSLSVAPAEIVVVTGARGSGKSLLGAVAAARLAPQRGSVWIGTRNILDLQRTSLPLVRRNIAYMPSRPPLLDEDSVIDNVLMALAVRRECRLAAREQALHILTSLGIEIFVDRPAGTLSAAERQLVALARTLVGRPPVIVLDEPVSTLLPVDRMRLAEALAAARDDDAAILCLTADETFAAALVNRGARHARMHDGRVLGGAPPMSLVVTGARDSAVRPHDGPLRIAVATGDHFSDSGSTSDRSEPEPGEVSHETGVAAP